jgi:phosphohistidine phosphatase
MDLIFWRHAEAEDWTEGCDDMARSLTSRGEKQAKRMASWLDRQLPEGTRIMCSPARRCEQTVLALGRKYKLRGELAPDTTPTHCSARRVAERQVGGADDRPSAFARPGDRAVAGPSARQLPVRKGAVWWIRTRERDGDVQTVVVDGAGAGTALKSFSSRAEFDAPVGLLPGQHLFAQQVRRLRIAVGPPGRAGDA